MKLYQPSNGTEGSWFESNWCDRCVKMPISPDAQNQCNILLKELCNEPTGNWILKHNVPICTAFVDRKEFNKKRKRYKKEDPNQLDLFKK